MIPGLRSEVRGRGRAWDDDDLDLDDDLDDEPVCASPTDVCGGVTSLDGFDLGAVETPILDRSDLHVMDDKSRIALMHRWTNDATGAEAGSIIDPAVPASYVTKLRYQYGNHLGSASLELDGAGLIISYEEFYPYGETSFMFGSNQVDVKLKEYRYTGKERDDSTSLYYYGQRYYAPWLCRWMSADPAGPVDGLNLYEYVSGNPIKLVDPDGAEETGFQWPTEQARGFFTSLAQKAGEAVSDFGEFLVETSPVRSEATDAFVRTNMAVHAAAVHAAVEVAGRAVAEGIAPIESAVREPVEMVGAAIDIVSGSKEEKLAGLGKFADPLGFVQTGTNLGEGAARIAQGDVEGGLGQFGEGLITTAAYIGMAEGLRRLAEPRGPRPPSAQGGKAGGSSPKTAHEPKAEMTPTGQPKLTEAKVDATKGAGRSGTKLKPDPKAQGPHSTFKQGPEGKTSNYATYEPNQQNPSGFQEVKRVDVTGRSHRNPDGTIVPTPHVKEPGMKGVRPATPEELP